MEQRNGWDTANASAAEIRFSGHIAESEGSDKNDGRKKDVHRTEENGRVGDILQKERRHVVQKRCYI